MAAVVFKGAGEIELPQTLQSKTIVRSGTVGDMRRIRPAKETHNAAACVQVLLVALKNIEQHARNGSEPLGRSLQSELISGEIGS